MVGKIEVFMEIEFRPIFEGEAIEVTSLAWDAQSGQCLANGAGYWTADPAGKLAAAIHAIGMGAVLLREVPDDPGGVAIEGVMPGNVRFTVALVAEGETLTLTTRRTEGYTGNSEDLTFAVMRRIGPAEGVLPGT